MPFPEFSVCLIVLILAFGATSLIIGIIQGYLATAIWGAVVLACIVWVLVTDKGDAGDEDDDYNEA